MDINTVGRSFLSEMEETLGKITNFRIRVADQKNHTFYKFDDDYEKFSKDGFHIIGLYTGEDGNPRLYNDKLVLYHCYPDNKPVNKIKISDCTLIYDFGIRELSFPDSNKKITAPPLLVSKRKKIGEPLEGDNIDYELLSARDRVCIDLCVPESSKPWLNELIKKGLTVKLGTFK
jgi:hypothetical protein